MRTFLVWLEDERQNAALIQQLIDKPLDHHQWQVTLDALEEDSILQGNERTQVTQFFQSVSTFFHTKRELNEENWHELLIEREKRAFKTMQLSSGLNGKLFWLLHKPFESLITKVIRQTLADDIKVVLKEKPQIASDYQKAITGILQSPLSTGKYYPFNGRSHDWMAQQNTPNVWLAFVNVMSAQALQSAYKQADRPSNPDSW